MPGAVLRLGRDAMTRVADATSLLADVPAILARVMTTRGVIEVRIEPPRIEHGRVHLMASVRAPDGNVEELWYAVDEAASDALVDTADPFVVAVVPVAMHRGHDVRVVGAAASPSLLDSLERFQEVWHGWRDDPMVDVVAEEERERDVRPNIAVTSFSGGVDSAFTAYRHTRGRWLATAGSLPRS